MKALSIIAIAALCAGMCGCSTAKGTSQAQQVEDSGEKAEVVAAREIGGPVAALPKAVIYKMNGDYAQYVPITLNADGTSVVSYPAPTDLTDSSTPVLMDDGYYLDRRGVSLNTRFTRYTYPEYRALSSAPSPSELMESLIPGARVVEVHRLPFTLQQAMADPAAVNAFIHQLK